MKKHHGACIGHVINSQGCVVPWEEESINKPETTHKKEYKYCLTCPGGVHLPEKHKLPYEKEECRFYGDECLTCHPEVEISHEKDFIEKALSEFREKFRDIKPRIGESQIIFDRHLKQALETFLKEKLTKAVMHGEDRADWMGESLEGARMSGRLAMKEEVDAQARNQAIPASNCKNIMVVPLNLFLAAIREMK